MTERRWACQRCVYFKTLWAQRGECRRHAPQPTRKLSDGACWPEVNAEHWCGEFVPQDLFEPAVP